jgi:hypothetical protein
LISRAPLAFGFVERIVVGNFRRKGGRPELLFKQRALLLLRETLG